MITGSLDRLHAANQRKIFEILTRNSTDGSSENAQHTTRSKVKCYRIKDVVDEIRYSHKIETTQHVSRMDSVEHVSHRSMHQIVAERIFGITQNKNACVESTKNSNCIFFLKVGWGFTRISTLNNKWREHYHECCSSDDGKFRLT